MEIHHKDIGLLEAIKSARRVFIVGNGGSAANAMHICNDLVSCGIAAHTIDIATWSAFSNDYGYEVALSMWLCTVARKGDLLIALSGSGTSPNIVEACMRADNFEVRVWKVFGRERGQDMQQAEEYQIALGHELRRQLNART